MRRILLAIGLSLAIAGGAAAQSAPDTNGNVNIAAQPPATGGPVAVGAAMAQTQPGGGVVVVSAPAPGGIINIGQALGPVLQPYVDAIVQALVASMIGWVLWLLKTKLNINIDQGHAEALTRFVQGRANSLIADGFVKMDGAQIQVNSTALASETNLALSMVPDAMAHFGVTPEQLAAKIKDAIPQVPAGAAIMAQAHAVAIAA